MENFNTLFDLDDRRTLSIVASVIGSPILGFTTDVPSGAEGDKRVVIFRCSVSGGPDNGNDGSILGA